MMYALWIIVILLMDARPCILILMIIMNVLLTTAIPRKDLPINLLIVMIIILAHMILVTLKLVVSIPQSQIQIAMIITLVPMIPVIRTLDVMLLDVFIKLLTVTIMIAVLMTVATLLLVV
jgi:hypothetical protein